MPDVLDVFRARCEARAILWAAGEFGDTDVHLPGKGASLQIAVDALVPAQARLAIDHGVSIDESQAIMAAAFRAVKPKAAGGIDE